MTIFICTLSVSLFLIDLYSNFQTDLMGFLNDNNSGVVLSIQIPFWSFGFMFMFVDYYNWPRWTRKYKLQPGTHEPLDLNRLKEV